MSQWRERARSVNASGLRHFGEAVLHYPAGSPNGVRRRGVFNDIYKGVDLETGFDVTMQQPNLGVILAAWPVLPVENDRVVIRGQNYRYIRHEKDGEGAAVMFLTRDLAQLAPPTQETGFAAVPRILLADLRVFGSDVIFSPAPGVNRTQRGIFSDRYEGPEVGSGVHIIMEQPNLGIRLAEWDLIPQDGDRITVEKALYRVRAVQVDGEGGATLMLDKLGTPNTVGADFNEDFNADFDTTLEP